MNRANFNPDLDRGSRDFSPHAYRECGAIFQVGSISAIHIIANTGLISKDVITCVDLKFITPLVNPYCITPTNTVLSGLIHSDMVTNDTNPPHHNLITVLTHFPILA